MASSTWSEIDQTRRDEYFLAFARGLLADGELSLGRISAQKGERQRYLEFCRQLAEEAIAIVDS